MDPTDLNRDDIARKSIRISSTNRFSKRIAPVPPPRLESINTSTDIPKTSTIILRQEATINQTPTDYNTQQLNIKNTLNSNMAAANAVASATKTSSTSPRLSTFSYEKRSPILLSSARESVVVSSMIKKIDESTSKESSELDQCPAVNNSGTFDRNTKAKMDFFATINDKETPVSLKQVTSQPATTTSIDVLNKLEQHINQMELDTKTNELFSAIPAQPLIKMNNRYGDHTNLLNTGISNVASGTALCYDADNDDDHEPAEFKRASESRNSTIAVSGASRMNGNGIGNLSKVKKPVSRAMSDTKNAETTVKIMRLKKADDETKAEQTARPPIGKPMHAMMSPLTNKKKEDTILMEADKISLNSRARAVATASSTAQPLIQPSSAPMPRRIVDRETLRHTVTPPTGSNRPKERVVQVKSLIFS